MPPAVFRAVRGRTVAGAPPVDTLTPIERSAVNNGWNLDAFRWAVQRIKSNPTASRQLAKADLVIPPTPSLHERIRTAAGIHQQSPATSREASVGGTNAIPPAPSLHERIRTAAGIHQQPATSREASAGGINAIPPAPSLHERIRAAAGIHVQSPATSRQSNAGGNNNTIPPTPSLHERIRAAAGRR